jgi:hypothetical protein
MREATPLLLGRRRVGHDDHEVEVAVRAGIAPRLRAEEIDPLGLVGIDEPLDDLRELRRLALTQVAELAANALFGTKGNAIALDAPGPPALS